jgi:S-adenosylmethionine:tRNA ribosyltransferase-isomerase
MDVSQFDFELPESSIALRPAVPRDVARLLLLHSDGHREDRHVGDLPQLLRAGDCLVFNNSKVIPVQLAGQRGAAQIGATLVERIAPNRWWAFVKNAKRIKLGDVVTFAEDVQARADERDADGRILWTFLMDAPLETVLDRIGVMPLPPYIASKRAVDAQDVEDYQTIFAVLDGSVAAPTAGLHFTRSMLDRVQAAGIRVAFVTLHVGPGTFLPVKVADTDHHVMHSEWAQMDEVTAARLNDVRAHGGRIIAVGTTALRVLESVVDEAGRFVAFTAPTRIFITPGYRFQAIDGLMTNFHLPRSTLFMLVCALAGIERMHAAYAHAIASGYRFYSYGDSSLLWRTD